MIHMEADLRNETDAAFAWTASAGALHLCCRRGWISYRDSRECFLSCFVFFLAMFIFFPFLPGLVDLKSRNLRLLHRRL